MEHQNYHQTPRRRMGPMRTTTTTTAASSNTKAASAAPPAAAATSSSNNTSWDMHYRRRGRTRERFDYAHASEELSPVELLPDDHNHTATGGAGGGSRSRSAESRPQYHTQQYHQQAEPQSSSTCMPMFYPGQNFSSSVPPPTSVVSESAAANANNAYNAGALHDEFRYYRTGYNHDELTYPVSRERAMGHMMVTATGSLNATNTHEGKTQSHARFGSEEERRYHQSEAQQHQQHQINQNRDRRRMDHDHSMIKDNLIMYGEAFHDAPTASTGLSQEELLQRKRREDIWQKRREKRNHKKKNNTNNRVVNLPSSLFSTNNNKNKNTRSSNNRREQPQQQPDPQSTQEHHYASSSLPRQDLLVYSGMDDMALGRAVERSQPITNYQKSYSDSGVLPTMAYNRLFRDPSVGENHKSNVKDSPEGAASSVGKGVRGSMMRRQRSDSSSSGRRWKILPGRADKSQPDAASEDNGRKQDPPAASASSRTKYPRDPPSVHSGKATTASEDSRTSRDGFQQGNLPSVDEFDHFMENPGFMTAPFSKEASLDSRLDATIPENTRVSEICERSSPNRPSYADFTPRSGYSKSLFTDGSDPKIAKETSPTSVMDAPYVGVAGVRWREILTEQQFVSPDSCKLDPFATDPVRYDSRTKPKSILRRGYAQVLAPPVQSPKRRGAEFFAVEEEKECPSDESPEKSAKRARERSRVSQDPPSEKDDWIPNSPSPVGFVDGNGRSVSPILGGDDVASTDDWSADDQGDLFDRDISPVHFDPHKHENETEQLSNSYVNFIEAVASVVIQTKVRQLLARIRVQSMFEREPERQSSKVDERHMLQPHSTSPSIWTNTISAAKNKPDPVEEAPVDFYIFAVIRIQAVFRGWWVRDCLAVDNYCATMIQKTYRGWLGVDASITRIHCIVMIQSFLRSSLVRQRMRLSSTERDVYGIAATTIQAQWRSFSCEMKYLRAYEDILVVQSVVRGWITRRLISSWLQAHHESVPQWSRKPIKDMAQRHNGGKQREAISRRPNSENRQYTPSRKPPKDKKAISPSYKPHIEYMKKTLTSSIVPPKETSDTLSLELEADRENGQKLHAMSSNVNSRQQSVGTLAVRACGLDKHAHKSKSNSTVTARSEVEERRHTKEIHAKARQDEEVRLQEAQAAELSELEFRRKRMAMKAEARKKSEEKQALPQENFSHDDEKKEGDSVIRNSSSAEHQSPNKAAAVPTDFLQSPRESAPLAAMMTSIGPWKLKKRNHNKSPSNNVQNTLESKADMTLNPEDKSQNRTASTATGKMSGSRPPFKGTGNNISARKQQLFSPRNNGVVSCAENQEVTSIDIAEMNSIVGTPKNQPTLNEKKEPADHKNEGKSESEDDSDAAQEIALLKERGRDEVYVEDARPKDVDVSALTEPTASAPPPSIATASTTPSRKLTGSSAAFLKQLRSQRSDAEQKRLDEMEAMFSQAGLMTRTKRSAAETYSLKEGPADQTNTRDLMSSWEKKDQRSS